jgi:hypothetical protein
MADGFRGIPGVPEGWELVRIGSPVYGEWYIDNQGVMRRCDFDKLVSTNHVIVRKIEKPKRWRILGDKEIIQAGEWYNAKVNKPGKWPPHGGWVQLEDNDISMLGLPAGNFPDVLWCREVTDDIETPKPAWEPQVGDWVLVTRPEDWKEWKKPMWPEGMHIYNGKVFQVRGAFETAGRHRVELHGCEWLFHRDWLAPAEPPKPPEPEYREPVPTADAGKECEFSNDGEAWWRGGLLGSFWISDCGVYSRFARIKKDA